MGFSDKVGNKAEDLSGKAKEAAGDVTGLVRQHADNFRSVLGAHDQAGIDEQVLTGRNECIKRFAVDDKNADSRRLEPRRQQEWRHVRADGIFGFSVPDKRKPLRICRWRDSAYDTRKGNPYPKKKAYTHCASFQSLDPG